MTDFLGIALLIFLSVLHGRTERYGTFWMVTYRALSTILHEICHLVCALVTFSKPTGFSLWPTRAGDGWILGSVTCNRVSWFSAAPVALAPAMICIPMAWFCFNQHSLLGYAGVFLFLTAAVPSWADMEVVFSSLAGMLFWSAVAFGWWWADGGFVLNGQTLH
jgi:hypothetical protein